MNTIFLMAAALSAGLMNLAQAAPAEFRGFCAADEQVVFACKLPKRKQVSLCASHDLGAQKGYLQYRFGEAGKPPELTFPAARVHPRGQFVQGRQLWAANAMHWYGFDNGGFHYAVGSAGGRDMDVSGVWVIKDGKKRAFLACQGAPFEGNDSKLEQALQQAALEQDTVAVDDFLP
ncbi:hypothetical protein V8J88_04955 [Massilia sp. W12]|uniref:hypothetical protein n=1 Tax=Massilia sp. W12 TaxID=3126507 RepID=UPI0030CDB5BA